MCAPDTGCRGGLSACYMQCERNLEMRRGNSRLTTFAAEDRIQK